MQQKNNAWQEYYALQTEAEKFLWEESEAANEARQAAEKGYRKVHHLMRAIIDHYSKHRCNAD